jgi:predicted nucleic acid-binding protein
MAGPLTVDASVFISAFNPKEPQYGDSSRLMATIRTKGWPMVVPTLVLPEVAAAISRATGDSAAARSFADHMRQLPGLILISLDETLATQAAQIASDHRLRGSDAVYGAVALRFGSSLVTLDREQHDRLEPVVQSHYPGDIRGDAPGNS